MIVIVRTVMVQVPISVCSKSTVSVGSVSEVVACFSMHSAEVAVTEVVADVSVTGMSEIVSDVMSDVMTNIVPHIVSEITVTGMPEIMSVASEVMSAVHIVSMSEVVSVAAHIVAVDIARMRCGSDQQKNKLEDQKSREYDGDAREDLLRQIECFKPIH